MEKRRTFQNEEEQKHYERLKMSMHNGLVFAENGIIADGFRDAVAYTTSLMLAQGITPQFTTGGDVWKMATEDFLQMDRKRIKVLIGILRQKKDSWKIKTGHRYSRRNNTDMV